MTIGDNLVNWDKITTQKIGYQELDKFIPGEAGLKYYPVPPEEWQTWKKEQDKKAMEEWESKEKEKKEALLNLHEEKPRGNGHNKPTVTFVEETVNSPLGISNEFCELKKKKKRGRPKKNVI